MRVESGLTGWHLAGTSLLDRSKEGEEEAEEEAAEAAPLIDVDCRRRCWELFFADVVTALALAELDAAAEGGIRDGTAALRAERRSIVKLVGRGEVLSEKEDRRKRESQWQIRVRLFFFFFFFFFSRQNSKLDQLSGQRASEEREEKRISLRSRFLIRSETSGERSEIETHLQTHKHTQRGKEMTAKTSERASGSSFHAGKQGSVDFFSLVLARRVLPSLTPSLSPLLFF